MAVGLTVFWRRPAVWGYAAARWERVVIVAGIVTYRGIDYTMVKTSNGLMKSVPVGELKPVITTDPDPANVMRVEAIRMAA